MPGRRPTHAAALRRENAALRRRLGVLRNAPINDLVTSLAAGVQQTNLTSFNPIIQNNIYAPLTIDWLTLAYMYKTHGPLQTAIEVPVLDALRGGLDLQSPSGEIDAADIKDVQDELEDKDTLGQVRKTEIWARLFGGGGLIVVAQGQDPATPLVLRKGMDVKFFAATRWELSGAYKAKDPDSLQSLPMNAYNARFAEFYDFYGKKVHHTRVLTMAGKDAPPPIDWQLQGWGMSEVERMVEDFNIYIKTKNVLYEILEEAKLDIFRMESFNDLLMVPGGMQKLTNRIQTANQMKNFNRALILDKTDEYEQKQLTFSGLAEVMKENRISLASALRIPMTKLFGLSASGFNSGEDDIENYNAMVESEVRQKLRPAIRQVLKIVCFDLFGMDVDVDFSFKPLRVMSSIDEETVKTSRQARAIALYDRGLYTPEEVSEELVKEKLVTVDTAAAQGLMLDRPEQPDGAGDGEEDEGKKGKEDGDGRPGKKD